MKNLRLETKEKSIDIPSSKSITHRALILASLSSKKFTLRNVTFSNDILATIDSLRALNKKIEIDSDNVYIYPSQIKKVRDINVLESGSTLRFIIPLALMQNEEISINGINHLVNRPIDDFFPIFNKLGISYEYNGSLPLKIKGILKPGYYEINGSVSSQFITGLLLTLSFLNGDSVLKVINKFESKSYVDMTLKVLKSFNINVLENNNTYYIKGNQEVKLKEYVIEPDFSQAAFFLVLNTFGKSIKINNLSRESLQGDKRIIDILEKSNVKFDYNFRVLNNDFLPQKVDLSDNPDIAPILAIFFSNVSGKSIMYGLSRLKYKECDRLNATYLMLKSAGVNVTCTDDSITIIGKTNYKDCFVDDFNDHRILMSAAILSNFINVKVNNLNSVKKSFPNFFDVYKEIGGIISE